jgi:ubiquinone/menaquinone biosynthesis C-methylase UbiE
MEEFVNPSKVLNQLSLNPGMSAVDFGCGSGGWTIPLARGLKEGKVYAVDIIESSIQALNSKARLYKISNIETIVANVEKKTPLFSGSCDLVLMTNLLFQSDNIKSVLEEGKRVLKGEGRMLIVDWIKDNPLTKEIENLDFDKVKLVAEEIGLKTDEEFSAGIYHKALILVK